MIAAACVLFLISLLLLTFYSRQSRREAVRRALEDGSSSSVFGHGFSARALRTFPKALTGRRRLLLYAIPGSVLLAFTGNPLLAVLASSAPFLVSRIRSRLETRKSEQKMEEQILDFIDSLNQSLRSGLSLQQSLEASVEGLGGELGGEIESVLKEIQTGGGLEESLLKSAAASSSPSMRLTLTVLGLLHGKGGDLPRLLDRMRKRVADIVEMRRETRMLTSQSRASGYLVSALPLGFLLIQAVLNPSSLRPLFSTTTGSLVTVLALLLNGAGFYIIQRLANPVI